MRCVLIFVISLGFVVAGTQQCCYAAVLTWQDAWTTPEDAGDAELSPPDGGTWDLSFSPPGFPGDTGGIDTTVRFAGTVFERRGFSQPNELNAEFVFERNFDINAGLASLRLNTMLRGLADFSDNRSLGGSYTVKTEVFQTTIGGGAVELPDDGVLVLSQLFEDSFSVIEPTGGGIMELINEGGFTNSTLAGPESFMIRISIDTQLVSFGDVSSGRGTLDFFDAGGLRVSLNAAAIPEPSTIAVWSLLGFIGVGGAAWRKRRKQAA